MLIHPSLFSRIRGAVLCSLIMVAGLSPEARADADTHAQEDAFAAEAAALLPAAAPPIAEATAPLDRITLGEWGAVIPWTPHIPVSAATLPDGRVLTFASNQRTTFPSGPEFTYAATWDPATGVFVEYNHPSHDMFCGGIATLPDGRVLVNGGRNTTVRSSIFDWRVNTWTRTPDMNDPRWYNTTVALPNGRAWTATGDGGSGTSERWDSASGWSRLTGINWNPIVAEPGYITRWHPFVLVSPDGRLIHFGPTDTMHWVSPDGTGSVSNTGTFVPGGHYPKEGSWVMYNEGRILVVGGGTSTANNASDTTTGNSTNAAYTVDVRTSPPVITPVASMTFKRQFANGVVLPNGEVMIMGGNTSGLKFNDTGSILTPEIWNPTTGLWRSMANAVTPRNYHSLALLLPDGRVLSGGGGLGGGDHRDAELFTPPNLFNADGSLAARPTLTTAPATIGVATTFNVTGTPGIQKFSFIKMSAITHSVNTDLRYLSLPFVETSPGNYALTAHTNLNVMTPGYWMLFGLNTAGAHSVAKIVLVGNVSAVSIATPGNQASHVGSPASLQMIGSGPVGSVLNWSATGLPTGLAINSTSGLISGTPTVVGTFPVVVTLTNGLTSATANFNWIIQPVTFSQNYTTFSGASGLTLNGNAAFAGGVLRLTTNLANQVGSAFLSNPIVIGPDTSISTRWVFRIHGSADGADGLTFVIQGNGPTAIGVGGGGLGYDGITRSVAVEVDDYKGATDPDANHIGILSNGNVTVHLATNTPAWDLEDGLSHTMWVEYDGPANQLRVYAAQGNVAQRPASPVMTASIDLSALVVGGQAWFGFTAGTGGAFNNQDIESWSLSVNAFALPAQPVFATPANVTNVIGTALTKQMQATDPNGDLLTWSATGLPTGLAINPASGLISGTPTVVGSFSPTVTVTDSNTLPVNRNFSWTINNLLTVQPLSGPAVVAGTTVPLTAQAAGGLNPQYRWNFGDCSPDTAFSSSPSTSHLFPTPGRFLVTVTVRDDTAREVTASYRQAVYAPPTATRPNSSTSIIYESRAGANARLWAVNPDNDSVTVFDAITRTKLAEVNVGRAPRSLALAPDGRVWVANAESATLTIIQTNYTIAQTVSLARGSRPFGLVFDPAGLNAYVALEAAGKILKLNPTNGATIATLDVGPNVRHLSITANGAQLLATRFITPRVPGEDTASPQTTVLGVKYGGEVLRINPTTFAVAGTVILEHSEESDTSNSARGIPNYLGAAVISPDGQSAWVPSKQDNIKRGMLRNSSPLTHDMSVRSIASRIDLATQTEDVAGRIDFDDGGIASSSAFDPLGVFLFTALEGSREIAVADAVAKQEILRFPAGRAPQGLVLAPDGRTLFVQNFMDRTITVHDLNTLADGSMTPPPAPVVLNCVTTEKLAANVLVGKQVFYDAQDNRIALQQYISCASCHNDGGQDGRIWDFTQFGEGLRNTTTLRGHSGTAQGPLHWTGNFDEVQDFEGQIRNFAGGAGLMSDTDFHAGTRAQPMGDPKAGFSAELDALAAYLASLSKNGDSPDRNADGTFTSAALAGQTVFQQQNCVQCHSGAQFTDSAINVFHDVGTLKPSSGQRLGAALTGLDTPTLRGLWANAPYLHNGSAATLEAAISAHNGVTLTAGELTNLVAFLRQLDDGGNSSPTISAIAGQVTTVNTPVPAIPFTINDTDTPLVNLTLSPGSSNLSLVPTNNIVFGGSGTNRTVTITPALHQIGTATITVMLSDGLLITNASFVVTVNPGQLTVTGITANNKIYDTTTTATLNPGGAILAGVSGGAVVTLNTGSATGVFSDKTVGNGKLVQIAGLTLGGTHASNYTLTQPTTTANITAKALTVTGVVANNKVYNQSTAAILNSASASIVGILGGDVVTLQTAGAVGTFANKNVGSGKLVTVSGLNIGGADAGNYVLTQPTTTADISPLDLLVTGITAANKPYDGTTAAALATGSAGLATVFGGDVVTLNTGSAAGTFANKNVGNGKLVTIGGLTIGGADAGNYTLTPPTTTANITAAAVAATITANDKVYDGTTAATLSSLSVGPLLGSDVVNLTIGATNFASATVGTGKTVTASALGLTGAASGNYQLTSPTATALANITALGITGSFTAANKVYDGATAATVLTRTLSGVLAGDTANVSLAGGTSSFDTKNIGAGKSVTLAGASLNGSAAGNYTLSSVETTTADITVKAVLPVIVANDKTYDGTTTATLSSQGVSGIIGAEVVTLGVGGVNFDTKNVGTGKTVTATTLTLGGVDAGNYVLGATSATNLATITALGLSGNFTAANKVYDGNNTATVLTRTLNGVLAADAANVSLAGGTASFDTKNTGASKIVTLTGVNLSGSAAGNYTLGSVGTTTAAITTKVVTPMIVANDKVYDGGTTATLNSQSVAGVIGTEVVTLGVGAANFDTKDVGTGKTVTATALMLGGADAGNYMLSTPSATDLADITALGITGSFTAANKVYDGTTAATVLTRTLSGVLAGDTANVSLVGGTASFATAAVGLGKTVALVGASLSGAAAGNYTLNSVGTTTADITARMVTPMIVANDKAYNGGTMATLNSQSVGGVIGTEAVTLGVGAANFDTKDVGIGKTVTATTLTLGGADAGNYALAAASATDLADITALEIIGNFSAGDKVYDGTTAATVLSRTLTGVLASDAASVSLAGGTASFDTKKIGASKIVTLTGASLSGAAAGNYTLGSVGTAMAAITAKAVTPVIVANDKSYDGGTAATLSSQGVSGTISAEVVMLGVGGVNFDTKNVGTSKTVTATTLTLSGADAGNYVLGTPSAMDVANITALGLSGNFAAGNKVYDGNNTATVLTRTLTGVLAGDSTNVSLAGGTASFDTKNTGAGKIVTLTGASLSGSATGNYTLSSVGTTIADITAKVVTPAIVANDKTYDGTTTATLSSQGVSGTIGAEVVTLGVGGVNFDTKNVGIGKTVTATTLTLGGVDAGNYLLGITSVTDLANITALGITGNFTAANKVYDGNPTATVLTRTLTSVLAGDEANVSLSGGTASFTTATVGAGKTVTLVGSTLNGSAAGNYTLSSVGTTTAEITAKMVTPMIVANDKPYDRTTVAALSSQSVSGTIGTEAVTLDVGTANFDTKDVGIGKTVTATTLTLGGANAGNYALDSTSATDLANITAVEVTGNFTAANKVYDGTTAATVLTRTLTGVLADDTANVSLTSSTAIFADANAGTGKTVTLAGVSLSGSAAGNYTLSSVADTTANITTLGAMVDSGLSADNKVYDGTTTATISSNNVVLGGVLPGDASNVSLVTNGYAATFADANVDSGKPVTVGGLSLTGSAAANYALTQPDLTADITAVAVTIVSGITAENRVYDGTTTATISSNNVVLAGLAVADTANVSLATNGYTAMFANTTAETIKPVIVTGLILTGTAATNYTLTQPALTATITARPITGSFTAANRIYDGTTTAMTLTRTLSGVLSGDTDNVTPTDGAATFDTADVGMGKMVASTLFTLTGSAATNYTLTAMADTTANITPASLTAAIVANDKVYDGTTAATLSSLSVGPILGSDVVSLTIGTTNFITAGVGVGKVVTASGLGLSGPAAGNYQFTASTATATADIKPKAATPVIVANDKTYDGNTTAVLSSQSVTGTIGVEVVTLGVGAANFDTKNVGMGRTVTATTLTLGGADASNYLLAATSATGLANITARGITGSFTAGDKVYDGTTAATVSSRSLTGVLAGDEANVGLAGGTAMFADVNVGVGKSVTLAGAGLSGSAADNYSLGAVDAATAAITALGITGDFTADNKVYDGNNAAMVLTRTLNGVLAGDTAKVSLTGGTATFADADVSASKTVTLMGATLTGSAAGNYDLAAIGTTTAAITSKAVTPAIAANDKAYDGNTTAALSNQSVTGVIGTEVVTLVVGAANFDNKNVGMGKTVTATTLSLSGAGAGNYVLDTTSATGLADITALGISGSFTAGDKLYDGTTAATVLTRTLSGVLAGDTANVSLDGGTASFAAAVVGAGKAVTLTGASLSGLAAGNYTLSSVNTATAAIRPVTLVVNADDQNRVYGLSNPILTASYSGFVGGETLATSGVTGNPVLSTPATNNSPAGDYPIAVAIGSLSAANYNFSFVDGKLIVAPAGNVTLSSITRLENNHTRITGTGDAGVAYIIQASSDLVQWQDIGTATAGANGVFEFEDPNAAHLSSCFYRVALP